MFWKIADAFRLKSLSLVSRLMILYSLSTIGILSAMSLFLYPMFIKIMSNPQADKIPAITAECFEKVILALLLGSIGAIFSGYIIARNGLNRMREFDRKMAEITADSLHERMALDEWPKELKQLGDQFNKMIDRIETSFIQLSQFSSDIAHELRTPIHNLRGMTEVALSKDKLSADYRSVLEFYMNEYTHLSKLIENLLFLARSDHGQLALNKETLDVRKEILNIFSYYQAMADEKGIELILEGDANLSADPILFKRVISNLLSNALRYTPLKGKITIDIKTLENHIISISVRDTGEGITSEHLPKIFDRFYRADSARNTATGELGLGLAIVKSIIDLHKGKIHIESIFNQGTLVRLSWPSFS